MATSLNLSQVVPISGDSVFKYMGVTLIQSPQNHTYICPISKTPKIQFLKFTDFFY